MNLLISTIMRDSARNVGRWYNQLQLLKMYLPDDKLYVSVYENDSVDGTPDLLRALDMRFADGYCFSSAKLNTPKYGSVVDANRVKLLADARNNTLDQATGYLDIADRVLSIEADIWYNPLEYASLVKRSVEYDIFSGACLNEGDFYDKWGTRERSGDKWYEGRIGSGVESKFATYSCFCVYNSEPMQNGVRFSGTWEGEFDCDTAVICFAYRRCGYDKIAIDFDTQCKQV